MTPTIPTEALIYLLRIKARDAYRQFHRIADNYECGLSMLKTVSSTAAQYAESYNKAMTELQRIDPKCPAWDPL